MGGREAQDEQHEQPAVALRRLVNGYQVSQAIHVATVLGVADHLAGGPRTSDELAADTGSHPDALYRLLRALAAVGVFREEPGRRFALTPLGDCLRTDAPRPVGPWAAFAMTPPQWDAWGALLHSVRTGENAFRHVHGEDVWAYRASHPEASAAFDRAMTGITLLATDALLAAYDFSRFETIVDVAGGQGSLLAAILQQYPTARGVLFDQPHVVAGADVVLQASGVAGRCVVVGGSFFEAVPTGGDVYMLKQIIHDWEDQEATAILRVCRKAMTPGGRLLVIERGIGAPNEGAAAKLMDLQMLVSAGGRERTRDEYATLFAAAGFRLESVISSAADLSIVEGLPI
jgi:hypothetical protein